jgi:hypothetical protein
MRITVTWLYLISINLQSQTPSRCSEFGLVLLYKELLLKSEDYLAAQLQLTSIVRGATNLAEVCRIIQIPTRCAEDSMVEGVKRFCAKLELHLLPNGEPANHGRSKVPVGL